ncbi:MAG: EAL domain-containing protein, partial [Acidobacteriota bacterium]
GVRVDIDDFGTGYSSLAQLRRLPIDRLKIDRAFIRDLSSAGRDVEIVRAVIELARGLGLSTQAEGIEEPNQLKKLVELNCEMGQGYLFARPLGAAEAAVWISARELRSSLAGDVAP